MGIPIVALILSFIIKNHEHGEFWINYLISVVFTAILWNGCFLIIKYYRNKYPQMESTAKRLLMTACWSTIVLVFGANIIGLALRVCTIEDLMDINYFFRHANVNLITGVIVASLYEATYFFDKWKKSIKLNEELKNQQIRTQFEVLQNQMSPHFLFNSLNTLTTLIAEDQKIAIDFTQTLSEVYRYILQNKERELVPLRDELEFSKSYIYLLKMRYPENLNVQIKVNDNFLALSIAPLTLQMLIENAIKHNVVSKTKPLNVEVYVENGESIVVKNNLQRKKTLEKSTKTGLSNIKKRYQYFGNREIDIITSQTNFMVAVPLIRLMDEVEFSNSDAV